MRSKFKWIYALLVALTMQFSFAQDKTVTGTVSDALGVLPGVNVLVKGTARRVTTDFDGKFSIKAKEGEILVFSFVEMGNTEKTVGAGNTVNVSMKANNILNEVIVTAGGITKRAESTTTKNQVVRSSELTQAANPNIIQSLIGKVSGLQISATSGGVNGVSRIVLRGNRSITGNNEALIVIDGAISSNVILSQLPTEIVESANVIKGAQGAALYGEQGANGVIIVTTKRGTRNQKLTVDFNTSADFENIAFLPTRQESYGQGWVGYGNNFGTGDARNSYNNFSPFENGAWGPSFSDPNWAGKLTPVGMPQENDVFVAGAPNGKVITEKWESRGSNNIKSFFKTGSIFQNSITLNVGGDDAYAFLNLKRESRDFMINGDKLGRTSILFKAGKRFGRLNIDGNVNYIAQNQSEGGQGTPLSGTTSLYDDLLYTPTNIDITKFSNSSGATHWTLYNESPYQSLKINRNDVTSNTFNGVLTIGFKFNDHINFTNTANTQFRNSITENHHDGFDYSNVTFDYGSVGYKIDGSSQVNFADYSAGGTLTTASSYFRTTQERTKFYNDLYLNFNYDLSKDLNFKLNLGSNVQEDAFTIARQGGTGLISPGLYNLINVKNVAIPSDGSMALFNKKEIIRRVAGMYQIDLDYKKFLFVNTTGRIEKTSLINKSFFYPSVGVSFIPTKLNKLNDGKVVNYTKVYANYVINGNSSAVGVFETTDYSVLGSGFPFGSLSGINLNAAPTDPAVKPEIITTKELGLGFGLFNDRITFDGSVYRADTKDLISRKTTSTTSGIRNTLGNIGSLENTGFKIDLGLTPIKTKDFKWSMKASYSTFKTKITSLGDDVKSVILQQPRAEFGIFAEVGEEFPLLKGTTYLRTDDGRVIVDASGRPTRSSTLSKLGKATPDYILNFTNTFNYKGFQLTAVMDYRTGASIFSETNHSLTFGGYTLESASQDRSTGYVIPNSAVFNTTTNVYDNNTVPYTVAGGLYNSTLSYFTNIYNQTGETQILDATAFRIREISFSYTLPVKLLKNTGLSNVRFAVNARNPFIYFGNPFKGKNNNLGYTDPEAASNIFSASNTTTVTNALGYASGTQYPSSKTIGFSLNVTF